MIRITPYVESPPGMVALSTLTPAPSPTSYPGYVNYNHVVPQTPPPYVQYELPPGDVTSKAPILSLHYVPHVTQWKTALGSLDATSWPNLFAMVIQCTFSWETSKPTRSESLAAGSVTRCSGIYMSWPSPSYEDTFPTWLQ